MPQETLPNSNFISPLKRGLNLKGSASACNNNEASFTVTEDSINDHELAQRKTEEAGINFDYDYAIRCTLALFSCYTRYVFLIVTL